MKPVIAAFLIGIAAGQNCAQSYSQCGGVGWTGQTCCVAGYTCSTQGTNSYYAQCVTATGGAAPTTSSGGSNTAVVTTSSTSVQTQGPQSCAQSYSQCGGVGWTGQTCCVAGYTCITQSTNSYYAQCVTATGGAVPTTTSTTLVTSISTRSSSAPAVSSSSISDRVMYAGVNIAGFEFSGSSGPYNCGDNPPGTEVPPITSTNNGPGQMEHFVTDDGMNAFRLPVSWQYLVNWNMDANKLDSGNFNNYNQLVQGCINAGAKLCIIDMHNYARVNDEIIGQSGPTATAFAKIWGQIAEQYAGTSQVAFGLMNEPHDGQCEGSTDTTLDFGKWVATLQGAVNAIRGYATSQLILLPGTDWDHAAGYTLADLQQLLGITDPSDPSGSKLVIEVHEYLDSNDSGSNNDDCTNNAIDVLQPFVSLMTQNFPGRKAFLGETGGISSPNCVTNLCAELSFLNSNSNVFLGWTGWAAGSFSPNSPNDVVLTPSYSGGTWTDTLLVQKCFAPCFTKGC